MAAVYQQQQNFREAEVDAGTRVQKAALHEAAMEFALVNFGDKSFGRIAAIEEVTAATAKLRLREPYDLPEVFGLMVLRRPRVNLQARVVSRSGLDVEIEFLPSGEVLEVD